MTSASASPDIARSFRQGFRGEVRFSQADRALYSTDASNHKIQPLGVVIPLDEADVTVAVSLAAEHNLPLLPRGSGTSLAGQAIGEAIILDVSKNLNHVLEIDPRERTAWVQPGVVCNQLNVAAGTLNLMYGPDPASADRATVGGMIGNNATGAHSVRYGMSADHVLALDVTLADGSEARLERLSEEAWEEKLGLASLEGQLYRTADRLHNTYKESIEAAWPKVWRRASGYSLNLLTGYSPGRPPSWGVTDGYPPADRHNLAPLIAGSEGTLAVIRRAKIRLVPIANAKALAALPFNSVADAVSATPDLLTSAPAAIELLPRALLERAATVPAYARKLTFVDEVPEALLVVEYAGDDLEAVRRQAQAAAGRSGRVLLDPSSHADLWAVRKAGLGLLMSVPGDTKPITFIEDVAVPVDRLAEYVGRVEAILTAAGTSAEWYAHASAGCLHLRPMVNLKQANGVRLMRSIADQVASVVLDLGGSMSGEHGDGFSHTEFNEMLYGPTLMQAFHELKAGFDPQGILNPGKVVPSPRAPRPALDTYLRLGPSYHTQAVNTHFAFQREGGLARAVEACTGVGICRKADGVMCPSYQATRDEMHATRGRANLLRAAISGDLAGGIHSDSLHEAMDLCLECKGCRAECPTSVDMARLKSEMLAQRAAQNGVPLRSRLFASIHDLARVGHRMGGWIAPTAGSWPARQLQHALFGVHRERQLPKLAPESFESWLSGRVGSDGEPVTLFVDTYTNYMQPEIGKAAVSLLQAAGRRVVVAEGQGCCGRPMISKGLLPEAKRLIDGNAKALADGAGGPIIVLEPSCLSVFQDEAVDLLPDNGLVAQMASRAISLEAFLLQGLQGNRAVDRISFLSEPGGKAMIHTHCHTKSLKGPGAASGLLREAGYEVFDLESGCCGMAGSFGYEAEHYQLSRQIGEMKVLPAVRQAIKTGAIVAAHGFSCRSQIKDGTMAESFHPLVLAAERLTS